jgi:hypothetical protein
VRGTSRSSSRRLSACSPCSGNGQKSDQIARGRKLFQVGSYPSCGFCHGMQSAAMTSPFADDLDEAVVEDMKGKSMQAVEKWALDAIKNAASFDPHDAARCMPKLLFTGKSAQAVAVFIATCAGHATRPGCAPVPAYHRAAARGFDDLQNLGCSSCHYANLTIAIARPLDGLYGTRVELANGKTVVANEAYLVESIRHPDAETVRGFPYGYMASRFRPGNVSAARARDIAAWLRLLK